MRRDSPRSGATRDEIEQPNIGTTAIRSAICFSHCECNAVAVGREDRLTQSFCIDQIIDAEILHIGADRLHLAERRQH
jgi:hypothetical protein